MYKRLTLLPKFHSSISFFQAAAQLFSVGMIIHAYTVTPTPVSSVLLQPWFVLLAIAMAVERLSGLALGVAMERDWVVLVINCVFLLAHFPHHYYLDSRAHYYYVFMLFI